MENLKTLSSLLGGYIGAEEPVNAAVIASGGGTTAEVYMLGVKEGWIPGLQMRLLISTVKGAGCIKKARACDEICVVVNRKSFSSQDAFNDEIAAILNLYGVELAFLAGCDQFIRACPGIYISNNHPAPKETDGGKGMHDKMVHEHVLARIRDEISRYPHRINEVHRTCIDHHEAIPRDPSKKGMDIGDPLTTVWVDIPPYIIYDFMKDRISLHEAAELLQKHVMRYEYASIISNAIMDGMRVRDAKKYGIKIGGF
ncbi:MAG: hypothetical protein RBS77_05625 [Candidatus Moranbacteria bacterium]|jgi:folate-dependent phosphoribosylglycinamide formyltransferase PurN|nr:hypothetical protein [Candidatus Moranbacteria bacterium]